MKRLLAVLILGSGVVFAQTITPIADIQFVADPATNDSSSYVDSTVTVAGIVTAEFWGSSGNKYFNVQDADTGWSGITIYNTNGWDGYGFTLASGATVNSVAQGDSVTVTGVVYESFGKTRIRNTTSIVIHDTVAAAMFAPIVVTTGSIATGGADAERYESVLVTVKTVEIDNANLGFGEWSVTDGSGSMRLDDKWDYYFWPDSGTALDSIVGTLDYSFSDFKLQPRLAMDVVEVGATRLQRIQQVRGSDLLKAPIDNFSDWSYFCRDYNCLEDPPAYIDTTVVPPVVVEGIVTMPTGLSFAGAGIKFIYQDVHGGPWSGIMSYDPDSSAFPVLLEGDRVRVTGYISEYNTASSFMTELWITQPIEILAVGQPMPDTSVVATGDLLWPSTAEQWGTVFVRAENAVVIDNNKPFSEWVIDDGTGPAWVDDDSDSLSNFVRPPVGTTINSVTGWVYHHFGSYADSNVYKLEPNYVEDVVIGGGPPSVLDNSANLTLSGPNDGVGVSVIATDNTALDSVEIIYRVDGGAWTSVTMTPGTGDTYDGTIPATGTEGALVEYFFKATDDGVNNIPAGVATTIFPDTSQSLLGYASRTGGPTILDVQWTNNSSGDSYYNGAKATLSGTITGISNSVTDGGLEFPGFSIQNGAGAWNGVLVHTRDTTAYTAVMGDSITVTGIVDELWEAWTFRFGNSTVLRDVQTVTVHSSGNALWTTAVTGAGLNADPESWEGVLVNVGEVAVTSINSFDWSVTDDAGVTDFLIDDDWLVSGSDADTTLDGLAVNDVIADLSGVFHFSFGTFKVEIRDLADLGIVVGIVDGDNGLPAVFSLSQNYPNPFNPSTTILYTLPEQLHHTLRVYNLLGAEVVTLVNEVRPAGAYQVLLRGDGLASGLYFLRLDAGDYHKTRKMILLK